MLFFYGVLIHVGWTRRGPVRWIVWGFAEMFLGGMAFSLVWLMVLLSACYAFHCL